jgi:hypothetical protein
MDSMVVQDEQSISANRTRNTGRNKAVLKPAKVYLICCPSMLLNSILQSSGKPCSAYYPSIKTLPLKMMVEGTDRPLALIHLIVVTHSRFPG